MTADSVAVFDFDHTLIDRDSLLPFLIYAQGWAKAACYLATLSPAFVGFLSGYLSRQEVKEKILQRFFKGWTVADIHKLGELYAQQQLDDYLKPEALQRLTWHQTQSHRCLLISASLEFYLKPWALRHGFEAVLASQLEYTSKGQITGRLVGLNCWGPEKLRRLKGYLGPKKNYILYAYGDSRGDLELLEFADYSFYRTFKRDD